MTNELYKMTNDIRISDVEVIAIKHQLTKRGWKDVKLLMKELKEKYNLSDEKVNQLIRIRLKQLIDNSNDEEDLLIKENLIDIKDDGSFKLNMDYFN